MRNFMTTLFISQGVPMIRGGDELGHTQRGNNNAYCQDNEISWLDWNLDDEGREFLAFVKTIVQLFQNYAVLRRRKFLQGRRIRGSDVKDVVWLSPNGREMSDRAWDADYVRCLGLMLSGDAMDEIDERGERVEGDTLLVLLSSHHDDITFRLPGLPARRHWQRLLDTREPVPTRRYFRSGHRYQLGARSVSVFCIATRE
jgi:glycogen operon protein